MSMRGIVRAGSAAVVGTALIGTVIGSTPTAMAASAGPQVVQADPCTSSYSINSRCYPRFTGYERPQPYRPVTLQEANQRTRQEVRQISCTVVRVLTPLFRAGVQVGMTLGTEVVCR